MKLSIQENLAIAWFSGVLITYVFDWIGSVVCWLSCRRVVKKIISFAPDDKKEWVKSGITVHFRYPEIWLVLWPLRLIDVFNNIIKYVKWSR